MGHGSLPSVKNSGTLVSLALLTPQILNNGPEPSFLSHPPRVGMSGRQATFR